MQQSRPSAERLLAALAELIEALDSERSGDFRAADECIRRAVVALENRSGAPAGVPEPELPIISPARHVRGGLAPWQIRMVSSHIDAGLDTSITTDALARLVRLSPSHFMRSFKVSFGASPHRYLVQRRIERAQGLMLTTDAPLGQIALECGLADQSHLAKLFHKSVGETPGAWRRSRIVARTARTG